MKDKNQTPAPKVSSKPKDHDVDPKDSVLKRQMAEAEKGAAKMTSATKTPQKISASKTTTSKREY